MNGRNEKFTVGSFRSFRLSVLLGWTDIGSLIRPDRMIGSIIIKIIEIRKKGKGREGERES